MHGFRRVFWQVWALVQAIGAVRRFRIHDSRRGLSGLVAEFTSTKKLVHFQLYKGSYYPKKFSVAIKLLSCYSRALNPKP